MSRIAVPRCAIAALISGTTCLPSPLKERATNEQPSASATAQGSMGWSLRRAADARHLGQEVRLDAQLVERLDHVVGDRVVTAPGTQRGRGAFVGVARKANAVGGHAHAGTVSFCCRGSMIASAGIGCPL